jgi:hypothetical protein
MIYKVIGKSHLIGEFCCCRDAPMHRGVSTHFVTIKSYVQFKTERFYARYRYIN